jgi:predicted oxidoreductase (fatty acid repression mutant protein)
MTMENKTFWDAVKARRSLYALDDTPVVSEARIEEIAADTLRYLPSPYNSQSTRLQLLFGEAHKALWTLTLNALRAKTPPKRFAATEKKIRTSFMSGYGTVLFYVDSEAVYALAAQFPLYAEQFALWSQHSCAMHQFVLWTALEAEGLGASLQHYNPLIDDAVKRRWNVPESWQLVAQMPFGRPIAAPGDKDVLPIGPRLLVRRDAGEAE